jgi:hypothetical protein
VVLPASGCEMIANVRRRAASRETSDMATAVAGGSGDRSADRISGKTGDYTRPAGAASWSWVGVLRSDLGEEMCAGWQFAPRLFIAP